MKIREKFFTSKKAVVLTAVLLSAALVFSFCSKRVGESKAKSDEELLEGRLCELCEKIDGVSRAYVMVTLSTAAETMSYSLLGNKEENSTDTCEVVGVGVVFTGDGGGATVYEVTEMVSRVLNIPINHVKVVKGGH